VAPHAGPPRGPRLLLIVACAVCLIPVSCFAIPPAEGPPPDLHLNDPKPTTILVRVVANGSMVLGKDVGGARVTITDVATKQILANKTRVIKTLLRIHSPYAHELTLKTTRNFIN